MRQQSALAIAEQLEAARRRQLESLPEDQKALGAILRKSVLDGDLNELAAYLEQHELFVARERLVEFRDYLIVTRIDLKDLEPSARERLRAHTLELENPLLKSPDFRRIEAAGQTPRCRDCQYFVRPPMDGSTDGDKACTYFGAKGADVACFGFKSKDQG